MLYRNKTKKIIKTAKASKSPRREDNFSWREEVSNDELAESLYLKKKFKPIQTTSKREKQISLYHNCNKSPEL